MEKLVELAKMKDIREELRWGIQCELDIAWTNARFLAPNPALEGRVPKHEFNFKPGTTDDTSFNERKASNEQLRMYIEGERKRKVEDEGCISLPVGAQQPTKKAKKDVTRKGKRKKPKKLEKVVKYMDLEDNHDEGGVAVWGATGTTWYSDGGCATYTRGEAEDAGVELEGCYCGKF